MNDLVAIQRGLIQLAEYYERHMTRSLLVMYSEDLKTLSLAEFEAACRAWRENPANTRFPLPGQLKEIVRPKRLDSRMEALDLAKKISAAIVKHGYVWEMGFRHNGRTWFSGAGVNFPDFKSAVNAELGGTAWELIRRRGGWQRIHDEYFASEEGTFTAQLRDQLEAVIIKARMGTLEDRVPLPEQTYRPSGLMPVAKKITGGDDR